MNHKLDWHFGGTVSSYVVAVFVNRFSPVPFCSTRIRSFENAGQTTRDPGDYETLVGLC